MIKADAAVVGSVTQAAQLKSSEHGDCYEISLKTAIPQKEGGVKEVFIFVKEPVNAPVGLRSVAQGQRVSINGSLVFNKKKDDKIYMNMTATSTAPVTDPAMGDSIEGTLHMIGVVGSKGAIVRNGKNGQPFMNFSAYSGDGDKDNRVFTWVRFIRFSGDVEPFLTPKALIEATGKMELQYFQDKLSMGCKLSEVKQYVKKGGQAIPNAPADAPF